MFGARPGDASAGDAHRTKLPRVESVFTRPDGRADRARASAPRILITPRGETGFVFTFQDVTESRASRSARRGCSSGWRRSARWRPASPTRSATRWRRCPGRCRSCGRSCRSREEQSQLMDIVLRESDRLNDTIRSFLAYARPQRNALTRLDVRQVVTDAGTLLQNSAELLESHRCGATCRRSRCGARPTKRRSGRSSGTWRRTACARCPTAAG